MSGAKIPANRIGGSRAGFALRLGARSIDHSHPGSIGLVWTPLEAIGRSFTALSEHFSAGISG